MHNVRCANSKSIYCTCSCQGTLHGTHYRKVSEIKEEEVEIKNLFCSNCGNVVKTSENVIIKGNKMIIRCPHCAKEWKI
jgi:predicted Zn-ribbon and HTH transcriptional regulator